MTKLRLPGAAALALSSALASPVMAQEVIYNPGYCAQFYPNANCQNKGPRNPYTGSYQRRSAAIAMPTATRTAPAMLPATASSASPAHGSRAKTAGATSASKMSRSRKQKGGCEAAFFMPAFGHRLSFRRVATNHHPLSKFNLEMESF